MSIKGSLLYLFLLLSFPLQTSFAQSLKPDEIPRPATVQFNRRQGLNMLEKIKDAVKENYYDKNFRGINIDERFKTAAESIKKLEMNWQIYSVIAQVVLEFKDSHTIFYPPSRANRVQYGFSLQMIGNTCFVVDVTKGSDAEAKGLKVGDVVASVGNFTPTRANLWEMNYILYALDPQESVTLFVLNPDRTKREIQITAAFKSVEERKKEAENRRREKKENPYTCRKINDELIACKLLTFSVDKKHIDQMMREIGAHRKLILDLRGNGGGYARMLEYLTGHFFDRDVKIGTAVRRNKTRENVAKTQKDKVFQGELIVTTDSESSSASEVFARIIQLEKRGKVVGDVSAGAVMTSAFYFMTTERSMMPTGRIVPESDKFSIFALNITVADLIMSDGNRLENNGVIPDHPVGPTGRALFEKADPVLAFAAGLLGAKISDEEAGKFYFLIPKPEADEEDRQKNDEAEN